MSEPYIPLGLGARFLPSQIPTDAPPSFAADANSIRTIKVDLGKARSEHEVNITGTILWALDASDLDAIVTVRFNDQVGDGVDYQQGMSIRGAKFDKLFLTNDSQPGKFITLLYAVEGVSNINIENALIGYSAVSLDKADTLLGLGSNAISTTTTVAAANAARVELTIQAAKGNTDTLEVLDAAANVCAVLDAGQSVTIAVTARVDIKPTSGTQTYTAFEVSD